MSHLPIGRDPMQFEQKTYSPARTYSNRSNTPIEGIDPVIVGRKRPIRYPASTAPPVIHQPVLVRNQPKDITDTYVPSNKPPIVTPIGPTTPAIQPNLNTKPGLPIPIGGRPGYVNSPPFDFKFSKTSNYATAIPTSEGTAEVTKLLNQINDERTKKHRFAVEKDRTVHSLKQAHQIIDEMDFKVKRLERDNIMLTNELKRAATQLGGVYDQQANHVASGDELNLSNVKI